MRPTLLMRMPSLTPCMSPPPPDTHAPHPVDMPRSHLVTSLPAAVPGLQAAGPGHTPQVPRTGARPGVDAHSSTGSAAHAGSQAAFAGPATQLAPRRRLTPSCSPSPCLLACLWGPAGAVLRGHQPQGPPQPGQKGEEGGRGLRRMFEEGGRGGGTTGVCGAPQPPRGWLRRETQRCLTKWSGREMTGV